MQIVEKRIDEITPYDNNPRINDAGVDAVAESIREFGFRQPIVTDADGVIIVGHTRYKAAQKLGLEKVPVLVADDMTDEQARAYRLADNKTGELTAWDFEALETELDEIFDIDMSLFGFDTDAIEIDDGEIIEDEIPETPTEARTKAGDLFQLGRHVLLCGDATSAEDTERLLGGASSRYSVHFSAV